MFKTEVYQPDKSKWAQIRQRILLLEKEAFGDKAFDDAEIEKDFLNPRNAIALLKDESEVIGFTYARPLDEADEPCREAEARETAYIWDTVIDKRYRGRHLVGPLMDELEGELRKRGYSFVERMAAVANDYAANVAKHYGDRVVASEPQETQYGKQVFFRIRL